MISYLFFRLFMPTGEVFDLSAPNVAEGIEAAYGAVPHLHVIDDEHVMAVPVDIGIRYVLTCLLCGRVNPMDDERTMLVAMQEHHMWQHDITPFDMQAAIRIATGSEREWRYIWALPQDIARCKGMAGQSYLRASRYSDDVRQSGIVARPSCILGPEHVSRRLREAVALVSGGSSDACSEHRATLIGEDELAWYGYRADDASDNCLLVWAKRSWRKA